MIRVLVVDDVDLARQRVCRLLAVHADVQVVGEACDGPALVAQCRRLQPDLVFLDISMPEQEGLSAFSEIPDPRPQLIVLTAYSDHALRAFRFNAVDYLVKPLEPEALAEALNRVRVRLAMPRPEPTTEVELQELSFRTSEGIRLVRRDEIVWFEAIRNYVALHGQGQAIIVRASFSSILQRMGTDHFVQLNRSIAVSFGQILRLKALGNGSYEVCLRSGKQFSVSRNYWPALARRLKPS